jgi:hypothetical protein
MPKHITQKQIIKTIEGLRYSREGICSLLRYIQWTYTEYESLQDYNRKMGMHCNNIEHIPHIVIEVENSDRIIVGPSK